MPHKALYLSIFMFFMSSLQAYEGYPVSLFQHVGEKSFEPLVDGSDSYVLEIQNVNNFYKEIAKSKKPVVLKIFSNKSNTAVTTSPLFQDIAKQFRKDIKFASLDISTNRNMAKLFMEFLVKLIFKLKASKTDNREFLGRIMGVVRRFALLEQSKESVPFVLFFKDGDLIFPNNLDFVDQPKLELSLQEQLFKNTGSRVKIIHESKKLQETPWRKFKNKVKRWWSK